MTTTHNDMTGAELRVAVASKDGRAIDMHFGHAEDFRIYFVGPRGVRFDGIRHAEHYCQGSYGEEDKRDLILRALADCAALFIARVGNGPRPRLQAAGIQPVDDYPFGPVEPSLLDWYSQRKQST